MWATFTAKYEDVAQCRAYRGPNGCKAMVLNSFFAVVNIITPIPRRNLAAIVFQLILASRGDYRLFIGQH